MDAIAINPTPTDKGKRLKIFYATPMAKKPPTFVIFVNEEKNSCNFLTCVSWKQIRTRFVFEGKHRFISARKNENKNRKSGMTVPDF